VNLTTNAGNHRVNQLDGSTLRRFLLCRNILMNDRYCHPQADAVEAAFSRFGNRPEVVTEGGHRENRQLSEPNATELETGA
jgi:hypothetical protein